MCRCKWKLSLELDGWLMTCSLLSQTEGQGVIPQSNVAVEEAGVDSLDLDDRTRSVTAILKELRPKNPPDDLLLLTLDLILNNHM